MAGKAFLCFSINVSGLVAHTGSPTFQEKTRSGDVSRTDTLRISWTQLQSPFGWWHQLCPPGFMQIFAFYCTDPLSSVKLDGAILRSPEIFAWVHLALSQRQWQMSIVCSESLYCDPSAQSGVLAVVQQLFKYTPSSLLPSILTSLSLQLPSTMLQHYNAL